jgi:hypothetical protein
LSPKQGSVERGPSELYLQLLKGEISSEEYLKRIKKTVSSGQFDTVAEGADTAAQTQSDR